MHCPGPVAYFTDEDDVSGNHNNCYWPLHSESIVRCKHHMQEKLVNCCTYLENLWFKIEGVPLIINFSTERPLSSNSRYKFKNDADKAVSVVSVTSSSGGYINGRNSANLELLIDKTSSIYLYVKLKTKLYEPMR